MKNEQVTQRVIAGLIEGRRSPSDLAAELDMDLATLAQHVGQPTVRRSLAQFAWLSEVRAQLLISSYRAMAAARLATLASADEPGELARRSCNDLLKLDLSIVDANALKHVADAPSAEDIRRTLESLGEEDAA
ncbi:MAG: hypothetical protein KC983_11130 [Phycisphaerales bacterium]|nr:hypothetical protein [Phycisphaerales bacterium]